MGKLDDTSLQLQAVNARAATTTLDEAMGALTLAHDAVLSEAGSNQTLSCAFSCMSLALKGLHDLRDVMAAAQNAHVPELRGPHAPKSHDGQAAYG